MLMKFHCSGPIDRWYTK